MGRSFFVRAGRLVVAATAAVVLLGGCASGSNSVTDASDVTTGVVGGQGDGGDPRSGGTETAAIYDMLMRYEPESKEYLPQLAKSLEANGDNTVWT